MTRNIIIRARTLYYIIAGIQRSASLLVRTIDTNIFLYCNIFPDTLTKLVATPYYGYYYFESNIIILPYWLLSFSPLVVVVFT